MQTCEKAQLALEEMLPANCSFTEFWDTYKQFSKMEFQDDTYVVESDMFLVEINKYDNPKRDFYFGVVRQFSFMDGKGDYCGMEQFICSLTVNETVKSFLGDRFCMWCDDFGGDADRLFETVESLPFFAKAKEDSSFQISMMATGV